MSQPSPAISLDSPDSQLPQRAAKACLACRRRKTRCDGERPACRACRKRGIGDSCNYEWLNRRHLRQMPENRYAADVVGDGYQTQTESTPLAAQATQNEDSSGANLPGSGGIPTIAGPNDTTTYGPASMAAFYRYITSNSGPENMRQQTSVDLRALPRNGTMRSRNMALLPRRSSADEFVYCFFEYFHPIFPVVNRQDFQHRYEQLWNLSGLDEEQTVTVEQEEATFAATLNMVFAIGSRISGSVEPEEKQSLAEDFYRRARDLYPYDILAASSFAVLQMLILMALYLQATQHSAECWNSLGLAIRVAQSLGLQANRGENSSASHKELNLRRQVWHLCVQLDRLFSVAFGRPSIIDNTTVPLPEIIDGEHLPNDGDGVQSQNAISKYGGFIQSCILVKILGQITRDMYQSDELSSDSRPSDLLNKATAINRQLDDFAESLPAYLQSSLAQSQVSSQDGPVRLQQQVLARRFLFVKISLFRPFILLSIADSGNSNAAVTLPGLDQSSVELELIRQYCRSCLQVVYQLSNMIYDNLGDRYCSSGWHNTHFAFCCSMVLLSAFRSPFLRSSVGGSEYETAWDHCMAVLDYYQKRLRSARDSRQVLLALRQQLSQKNAEQNNTDQNPQPLSNSTNDMAGFAIPTPTDAHFAGDYSAEDLFSLKLDCFSDAWLNPYLQDLDLSELFGVS